MMSNVMEHPRIDKVVVNIGVGESGERLGKAEKLLAKLTNRKPVRTNSKHKIPAWNIRKGEPIGCKVTLRGEDAVEAIKNTLHAKDNTLRPDNFAENGSISFGIAEYIDIQGLKYDPEIGIFGMNVNIKLKRAGHRIQVRSRKKAKVADNARVSRDEALEYMKEKFGVKVEEEE
jgi:large subunit ribosomal protein L5